MKSRRIDPTHLPPGDALFSLLAENVREYALMVLDPEGYVAVWNLGAERLLGYSDAEIIGTHCSVFFTSEDVTAGMPEQELEQARRTGRAEREHWLVRKDRSRFWASGVNTALYNAQNQAQGFAKIIRDVTEQQQRAPALPSPAQPVNERTSTTVEALLPAVASSEQRDTRQKIEAAEQRYRLLLESTGEGIYGIDHDGTCTFINAAAAAMFGYSVAEVIGQDMHRLIHHSYADSSPYPAEECPVSRSIHRGTSVRVDTEVFWRKDGTAFPVEYASYPIRVDGQIQGAVVTCSDNTERKRIAAALGYQRTLLEVLNEGVPDAILVVSPTGKMLYHNQNFPNIWHIPPEIMESKDDTAALNFAMTQVLDPEAFISRVTYLYAHPHDISHEEVPFKDGRVIDRYGVPVRGENGTYYGWAWVFRDITQRKQAEQEREQLLAREQAALKKAQEAVRVRDAFLSIASHELKNPLTSLLGNAQALGRRAEREPTVAERDQRALATIADQAQRLNQMIDTLLDSSRIDSGQMSIQRLPLDLAALTERIVEEMQSTLKKHTMVMTRSGEELLVAGDDVRLTQVLQNLLGNAVKYSPHGGAISVHVGAQGANAYVAVRDEGLGIPQAAFANLFDRFFRAKNAEEYQIRGMGVGLYVVKEIVTLHGGTIEVESEEGKGSTFTIRLPFLDETHKQQAEPEHMQAH